MSYIKYKNLKNLIKLDNKMYKRASVMIVELSEMPTVFLFYDEKYSTYMEPGGRIDKDYGSVDNTLLETGKRELKEETMNTFSINGTPPYIDCYDEKLKYYTRLYIIIMKQHMFDPHVYYDNKNIVVKNGAPNEWHEMNDFSQFYISDLLKCSNVNDNTMSCVDVIGRQCNVYYRTIMFVQKMSKEFNLINDVELEVNDIILRVNHMGPRYVMGTKTYVFKM